MQNFSKVLTFSHLAPFWGLRLATAICPPTMRQSSRRSLRLSWRLIQQLNHDFVVAVVGYISRLPIHLVCDIFASSMSQKAHSMARTLPSLAAKNNGV